MNDHVAVGILNSADYPDFQIGGIQPQVQFWATYLGGFASQNDVTKVELTCQDVFHETCLAAEPNP